MIRNTKNYARDRRKAGKSGLLAILFALCSVCLGQYALTVSVTPTSSLIPGSGWSGSTSTPAQVGANPENTIAFSGLVPYQTLSSGATIPVYAVHSQYMDYVIGSVDGGAWQKKTGSDIYSFTLLSGLSDGTHEFRAIAYPVAGVPRVISGVYFSANGGSSLPTNVKYVATDGDDMTGDGSSSTPYATILKAAKAIQTANGDGTADGGTVYLKAGNHTLGAYSFGNLTTTTNRWLTIKPAPGLTKADVKLVASTDGDGLRTHLVHLQDLTIQPNADDMIVLTTTGDRSELLWLDDCALVGRGRTVDLGWATGWSGIYATDVTISHCRDGLLAAFQKNVTIDDIGAVAVQNPIGLVVNLTVSNVDDTGTSFHPDIVQFYPGTTHALLYGITATSNINCQGLFSGADIAVRDVAAINCNITVVGDVWQVFTFGGPTRHLYVRDSAFVGNAHWATQESDMGAFDFAATNCVIENTTFSNSPGAISGVTYR